MAPVIENTLKIYIPYTHSTLRMFYMNRITDHNNNLSDCYADSGFDIGLPTNLILNKHIGNKLSLGIHAAMWSKDGLPQAYYLYPRSSISKTPLRLSNSVGIIDRGYRGELAAMVDIIDHNNSIPYTVNALDRYFQICHPSLNPFKVELVNTIEELGTTVRGEGGFGSTGL
jgi:dUTP pyrophosphatase